MRLSGLLLAATAFSAALPAHAADTLKFGPAPSWVIPQKIPDKSTGAANAPAALLLTDEQVQLEPGRMTSFAEIAVKLQSPDGLSAGNIAFPWNPAFDSVTVNKLHIIRGGKVIDVLGAGQTFTVARRETNLDAATLDGTLTAALQPEDLQLGDVVDFAMTIEHSDPTLKTHVEGDFAQWNALPIELGHVRLSWPAGMTPVLRQSGDLPAARQFLDDGRHVFEMTAQALEPPIPPKSAPMRYRIGRLGELSDFQSWAQLADLFEPLFQSAAVIPPSGPLRDELESIRKQAHSPKERAELALQLVENRVRYVALAMGTGGLVPASAETTWSRRFGDCKAKTALLLGLLHELGIEAEPVLADVPLGDSVAGRLPMAEDFDHAIVRAHIGGKSYWLDGTRTGDTDPDEIQVPDFGWVLPLTANAALVHLVPPPLEKPSQERHVDIDATAGLFAPAAVSITETYRGDTAVAFNSLYSSLSDEQRDQALREEAKGFFDTFTLGSSSVQFEKTKRELTLTIKGTAKLNWEDSWFDVPTSSIGYDPDFDRAAGPNHDVPFNVSYPSFAKDVAIVHLPRGVAAQEKLSEPVHSMVAGIEYARTETLDGDAITVESSAQSLQPEIAYKDAIAAAAQLKALSEKDVYLRVSGAYTATDADMVELSRAKPETSYYYFIRGQGLLARDKEHEALANLNSGLALDPKNAWALIKRAGIYLHDQQVAEAESDLKAAEAIDPSGSDLAVAWGDLALAKGDVATAVTEYDKALIKDPNSAWAHTRRAGARLQLGKTNDAISDLNAALASEPRNVGALSFRAELLAAKEEWDLAEKDIDEALKIDPENAAALAAKANIKMQRKDYAGAEQLVTQALQRDPNSSFARGMQAQLLKRSGGEGQAIQMLDQAVANAPGESGPILNRASAYLTAKNYDAADKDVAAALKINPADARALHMKGSIALARGDYKAAIDALTQDLDKFPSDSSALSERAEAYRQLRDLDLALADTDVALKAGLVSPELRLLRINILVQKGDLANTVLEADQLVKENPASDFALVAAGKTYAALGMRQKAMESFDRALAIKPYAYIYINRSQVRPYADIAGKLADLDKALALDPNNESVLAVKASLLSDHGRSTEALPLFDKAIATSLDGSYLQLGRAVALQRAGRTAEAKRVFDSELAKAKTAPDLNRLCWTKAVNGVLLDSALQNCRDALRLDPGYKDATDSLAMVLLKLGDLKQALIEYNKAFAANSGAEALMGRAIVRARLGDAAGAQADALAARRLRPDIDDTFAEYGLKFDQPGSEEKTAATTKTAAK